jgi:DNA transformation protein and related proteins
MAVTPDYLQYILEQLATLPHVSSRRMFGAIGLYSDGLFFGLIDNDTLFFKVNDSNRNDYVSRGMAAFCPFPDKPDQSMSYFEVPADALEDRDELTLWARKSVAVALSSPKPRRSAKPKAARTAAAKAKAPVKEPARTPKSAPIKAARKRR